MERDELNLPKLEEIRDEYGSGTVYKAVFYNIFNMCGCGQPYETYCFLYDVLKAMDGRTANKELTSETIQKIIQENPEHAAAFIVHIINNNYVADHGGSWYGSWLTQKGQFIVDLGKPSEERFEGEE
jgi:hypothetical protein